MKSPRYERQGFGLIVCTVVLAASGCSRDVRLVGKKVPTVKVGSVTQYGVTLDENASPEQVAYVALRAIRDDFFAKDDAARQKALDIEFSVSAADVLQSQNLTSLSRDEFIYGIVNRWTPTVSHYAGDFEEDWGAAKARMHRRPVTHLGRAKPETPSADECEVAMVVKNPNGDPNANVVMLVWMVRDGGLWRVTHLGFDLSARTISGS